MRIINYIKKIMVTDADEKKVYINEMERTRNIILIGRSGNGKSTLANVLSGSEKFKESGAGRACTKRIEYEDFQLKVSADDDINLELKYRVIDTVGIGDTELSSKEVLARMVDAANVLDGKIYQIFFVVGGRFHEEEITAYQLLKEIIFDNQIVNYTTIVRTHFPKFENLEECKEETERLCEGNAEISKLVNSCNGIIYIDNPPLEGYYAEIAKVVREKSRKKLLEHLVMKCGNYFPTSLAQLEERVENYKTKEEKFQEQIALLEAKIEQKTKESAE